MLLGGSFLKSEVIKRAAYSIFILAAASALFAMLSGEGAEEVIEGLSGVDEQFISAHEETAEAFAISLYLLGALSIVGLWANWKQKWFSNTILLSAILLSLAVLFYAKQTGTSGGEIRHPEIRAKEVDNTPNPITINDEDDDKEEN
jgi:uncharacterized membrane protein